MGRGVGVGVGWRRVPASTARSRGSPLHTSTPHKQHHITPTMRPHYTQRCGDRRQEGTLSSDAAVYAGMSTRACASARRRMSA